MSIISHQPTLEIEKLAKSQTYLFIVYLLFLGATVILTLLVWRSQNKYQDAVRADANKKVAIANATAETAKADVVRANQKIADLTVQAESLRVEAIKVKEEISVAQAQSATANAKAAIANQQAAEANEKAEAERLVRVKLEIDLSPRIVTINNEAIEELKLFSGTKVFIEFEPYDIEAIRLAGQIRNILAAANWDILKITPKTPSATGIEIIGKANTIIYGENGVKIYSKTTKGEGPFENMDNKWNDAGKILSYRLMDNKIEVSEKSLSTKFPIFPRDFPEDAVLVIVDSKPQPYFQDKQRLESLDQSGFNKVLEESKHKQERLVEEGAKTSPFMRKMLEESKQHKESIRETWERFCMQDQRVYQKAKRAKIIKKYKEIKIHH